MLTINQIKEIIKPIAEKYGLEAVYLFESQARGEASPESDYDFYVKRGKIKDLFELSGLFIKLKFENLDENLVDIINTYTRYAYVTDKETEFEKYLAISLE